jgi:hypothetical protein
MNPDPCLDSKLARFIGKNGWVVKNLKLKEYNLIKITL